MKGASWSSSDLSALVAVKATSPVLTIPFCTIMEVCFIAFYQHSLCIFQGFRALGCIVPLWAASETSDIISASSLRLFSMLCHDICHVWLLFLGCNRLLCLADCQSTWGLAPKHTNPVGLRMGTNLELSL